MEFPKTHVSSEISNQNITRTAQSFHKTKQSGVIFGFCIRLQNLGSCLISAKLNSISSLKSIILCFPLTLTGCQLTTFWLCCGLCVGNFRLEGHLKMPHSMVSKFHFDSYHCMIRDILVIPCMVHFSNSTDQVLIGQGQVNFWSFFGGVYFPG